MSRHGEGLNGPDISRGEQLIYLELKTQGATLTKILEALLKLPAALAQTLRGPK